MILPKILHDIMVRHFTSIPKMCALPIKAVYWCSVDWLSNLWGLTSAVCQPVAPIDTDNGWSLHVVLANDCYYCSLQQLLHLSLISKTSCVAVRVYYFVWNTLQICVWVPCESHSYRTHWLNLSLHWFSLFKGNSVSLHQKAVQSGRECLKLALSTCVRKLGFVKLWFSKSSRLHTKHCHISYLVVKLYTGCTYVLFFVLRNAGQYLCHVLPGLPLSFVLCMS